MRIAFLIHTAYGIGGTIRTTRNLAGQLAADGHDVQVVSVFRHHDTPLIAHDPRIRLCHLADIRGNSPHPIADDPRHQEPSRVYPAADARHAMYSALTDELIGDALASLDADVVVGTRPGLNVHLARQAPRRLVRVAQEHLTLGSHPRSLLHRLRATYPLLDAVTTTTRADAAAYRRRLPGVPVTAIPNSAPPGAPPPSDCSAPVVAAAGRLAEGKHYDDLVRAFARVCARHPEWSLRLYGAGGERAGLQELVTELGVGDNVRLMGAVTPIEPELASASVLAVTSTLESFGMTIVEGMRAGLPVVATDCPHGPREIIHDGVDGLLVPPRDVPAIAAALLRLVEDDRLRRRMGRAALAAGERFDPAVIAAHHLRLFGRLLDARAGPAARPRAALLAAYGRAAGGALSLGGLARAGAGRWG